MVNTKPVKLGKNIRQSFAHIDEVAEMPNLIEVQKNSYQWFLDEGLRAVFKDISSITDYQGNLQLDFIDFTLDDKPKYPLLECKERDVTMPPPCACAPGSSTKSPARSRNPTSTWEISP